MLVFINAASFDKQGTSVHHAAQLLRTTMEALERLQQIGNRQPEVYRDAELHGRDMADGVKVKQAFAALRSQIKEQEEQALMRGAPAAEVDLLAKDANRFTKLLTTITDSPLAPDIFDVEQFESEYQGENVSFQAAGYAAHFTFRMCEGVANSAVILSLSEHPRYREPALTVLYIREDQLEERSVWNVAHPHHIRIRRLQYDHNQKHPLSADIKDFVSVMDLKPEEAQFVLDHAVALEGERRVFAHYNGAIYIFPRHLERREQHPDSQALHHGYKVADPRLMRSRLIDESNQLCKLPGWEMLRP